MRTAYVQTSPISVSYANILHLKQAVKSTGAKRFFLCIWDAVAYEDPSFFARSDGRRSRTEQVQENAHLLEKILSLEGVEVSTVYLSEAWSRLFSKPPIARTFNTILSKTNASKLEQRGGIPGEDLTLSRINYTIADALIAAHFHKLFPEISASPPTHYVTTRRSTPFLPTIRSVMNESKERFPNVVTVAPFPFLMDSKGLLPSMEMNRSRIESVVRDALLRQPLDPHHIERLKSLLRPGHPTKRTSHVKIMASENPPDAPSEIAQELHRWLSSIKRAMEAPSTITHRAMTITNPDQFHRSVRPLSAVKLRILSLCDGSKTSYHIAKALGLKQVTVSVYLGRLRILGFITDGRRPERTVSSLIVDLDAMKPQS